MDLAGESSHVPDGGDPAHDAVPEVEGDLPIHLGDDTQVHVSDEGDGDVDVVVDQAGEQGPAAEVHGLVGGERAEVAPRLDGPDLALLDDDHPVLLEPALDAVEERTVVEHQLRERDRGPVGGVRGLGGLGLLGKRRDRRTAGQDGPGSGGRHPEEVAPIHRGPVLGRLLERLAPLLARVLLPQSHDGSPPLTDSRSRASDRNPDIPSRRSCRSDPIGFPAYTPGISPARTHRSSRTKSAFCNSSTRTAVFCRRRLRLPIFLGSGLGSGIDHCTGAVDL